MGAELRAKLWTLRRDGLAYWSVMHLALFSIPVWWVQPIADNISTMIFNIYQSFLSHQTLDSLEADDNQASTGSAAEPAAEEAETTTPYSSSPSSSYE